MYRDYEQEQIKLEKSRNIPIIFTRIFEVYTRRQLDILVKNRTWSRLHINLCESCILKFVEGENDKIKRLNKLTMMNNRVRKKKLDGDGDEEEANGSPSRMMTRQFNLKLTKNFLKRKRKKNTEKSSNSIKKLSLLKSSGSKPTKITNFLYHKKRLSSEHSESSFLLGKVVSSPRGFKNGRSLLSQRSGSYLGLKALNLDYDSNSHYQSPRHKIKSSSFKFKSRTFAKDKSVVVSSRIKTLNSPPLNKTQFPVLASLRKEPRTSRRINSLSISSLKRKHKYNLLNL